MKTLLASAAIALLFASPTLAAGQIPAGEMHHHGAPSLEELVVRMADTPEEHRALADYFRHKAMEAREIAARHRSMASAYAGTKLAQKRHMKEHCENIAKLQEQAAAEYEALAERHASAAGQ